MELNIETPASTALNETVESVLCALDRWTARNDGHHTEKRATRRHPYRALVQVTAPHNSVIAEVRFFAHTRDISVSGLSFVVSKKIPTGVVGHVVQATSLLQPNKEVVICVPHGDHDVNLVAEIRRLRKVHDNLYECGVQFVGRNSSP